MPTPSSQLLVLGHLTRDLLPDGASADGGTALYAAVAAQRLGMQTAVFSAAPTRPRSLPPEIALAFMPAVAASTFENRYGPSGRLQWLLVAAPSLQLDQLPESWQHIPLVHLGPVLQEIDLAAALDFFPRAIFVVTPQGWMRRWPTPLPSRIERVVWSPDPALLARIDLLVMSIEDLGGDEDVGRGYSRFCRCVVVTRGEQGATLYLDGRAYNVPTTPVVTSDPTGLGDVFAASLLIRFAETGDHLEATRFATRVATITATGSGLGAIPTRAMLDQRLIDL